MESNTLLEREAEFRKLNNQLEKKTASLLKEIENSLHNQDEIFNEYTPYKKNKKLLKQKSAGIKTITKVDTVKKQETTKADKACDCGIYYEAVKDEDCMEFLEGFVKNSVKEAVLPNYFLKDELNIKNVCNFLASKVKILQEQIEKQQSVIDKKAQQCEQHMRATAEMETDRLKLKTQLNSSCDSVSRLQGRLKVLESQIKESQVQQCELSRQLEAALGGLKAANCRAVTAESKTDALYADLERTRAKLDSAVTSEKELRLQLREQDKANKSKIAAILRSKSTLNAQIDKQTRLIDNLKKQRDTLSMIKVVGHIEKEFLDVIDLKSRQS